METLSSPALDFRKINVTKAMMDAKQFPLSSGGVSWNEQSRRLRSNIVWMGRSSSLENACIGS